MKSTNTHKPMARLFMLSMTAALLLAACAAPAPAAPAATSAAPAATTAPAAGEATAAPAEATAAPSTDATAAPAASGNVTTIRVSVWESSEALEPWNNALAGFEKANPDIKVQLESVPQEYGTKLLAQLAAGTAPDVFQVGDGDVAKYVNKGVVEPLDDYIARDNFDTSVFYEGIYKSGQVNGKTYFLTKDYSPLVLYYNKALFDKANVPYPKDGWTWQDFLATAEKLTVRDGDKVTQWGVSLPNTWGDLVWDRGISPFFFQNETDILSPDGKTAEGFMNSPATVEALQFYVDLINKNHVAPNKVELASLQGVDLFATGKAAMQWTGRWPIKDYRANKDLSFATVSLPKNKKAANAICWAGFGMYTQSQHKEEAWKLLKYIGAGDGAKEFANYALTAVKSIADSQGLTKDPQDGVIMAGLDQVVSPADFRQERYGDCVAKAFKENLDKVFADPTLTLQPLMDAAAKQADDCLAQP